MGLSTIAGKVGRNEVVQEIPQTKIHSVNDFLQRGLLLEFLQPPKITVSIGGTLSKQEDLKKG